MSYPIYGMVERARLAWTAVRDEDCCQEAQCDGDEACAEHAPLLERARHLAQVAAEGPEWDEVER